MVNLVIVWKDIGDKESKTLSILDISWINSSTDVVGTWLKEQPFLNARFIHECAGYEQSSTSLCIQHMAYERNIDFVVCHNDEFLVLRVSLDDDGDVVVRVGSKHADGLYRQRYCEEVEFNDNMIVQIETEQIVEYYDNTIVGFIRNQ